MALDPIMKTILSGHRNSNRFTVLPIVLSVLLLTTVAGALKYSVGDSVWSISPSNDFYDDWSASQTFRTGDVLYFDFESVRYNLLEVRAGQYYACSSEHSHKRYDAGPATVPLIDVGDIYFICDIFDYCSMGMKMMVYVNGSASPAKLP